MSRPCERHGDGVYFIIMPLQFGHPQDPRDHVPRPSAYAVILRDDGLILAVIDGPETMLPGGGIDDGEDARTAVVREIMEETGFAATIESKIGDANEYVFLPKQHRNVNKISSFYLAYVDGAANPDVVPEHEPVWITADEFAGRTSHESHAWAVRRAFEARR